MSEPERIKDIIDEKSEILNEKSVSENEGSLEETKPKNGGVRPGAGRPKGSVAKSTRTALEAKNRFIERVHKNVDTLFDAQLALAKGEQYLFVKYHVGEGKNQKTIVDVVEDRETIADYLQDDGYTLNHNEDDAYYYISTKPANNQAIDSLLNRAFGKAPEKIEIEGGFFKANQLNIQIVSSDHVVEGEIIEGDEVEQTEMTEENDISITETQQETELSA